MVRKISDIILAAVLALFLISASVIATVSFRPLYYADIDRLQIAQSSGYSEQKIRENYDALISYSLSPLKDELIFPSLTMSEKGRIHLAEVKEIFQLFLKLAAASAILTAAGYVWKKRRREYGYLLFAGIGTPTFAAVLGILIGADWDRAFWLLHKLVFQNMYWLFDPKTDPVINILPDEFFLHCAVMILTLIAAGSAVCLILFRRLTAGKNAENLQKIV